MHIILCVQNKVKELEIKFEAVEGEKSRLEEEAKEHRQKISELEDGHQKNHLELTNQLEELKMKVCVHVHVHVHNAQHDTALKNAMSTQPCILGNSHGL